VPYERFRRFGWERERRLKRETNRERNNCREDSDKETETGREGVERERGGNEEMKYDRAKNDKKLI